MGSPPGPPTDARPPAGVTRRSLLGWSALGAASFAGGCSALSPGERQTADGSDGGPGTDDGAGPDAGPERDSGVPIRLAAHEFVPVGETRELGELGEILEVIEFDGRIELDDGRFTCLGSGVVCIRARYRRDAGQNSVQTKCVVGIEGTGPCAELEPATFDLQRFSDRPGDSNLLASGEGRFYRVCDTVDGLRLEQPERELPPLYFQVVDALGDGAYAISHDEYAHQRRGTIRTYSGNELAPPWIVFLGGVTEEGGTVTPDGEVSFEFADCLSPECTEHPAFVRAGDIVEVGPADIGDLQAFRARHGEDETAARLNALLDRHDVTTFEWEDIDGRLGPYVTSGFQEDILELDLKGLLFERLVRLQAFERTVAHFDAVHSLGEKGVTITLFDDLLNVPVKCPSQAEGARAVCDELESAIAAAEARTLSALGARFDLWAHVSHWEEPADHRPEIEHFDGVLLRAGFSDQAPIPDQLETVPAQVRAVLSELSSFDIDGIVLVGEGPVSLFSTPGVQCEADFCPSDFGNTFRLNEALLEAFLSETPDLAAGFGVPTFEGAQFDIRHPVEDRSGYELNRVGETGYNNPTLNVYATR